jgi:hypothetical protein
MDESDVSSGTRKYYIPNVDKVVLREQTRVQERSELDCAV